MILTALIGTAPESIIDAGAAYSDLPGSQKQRQARHTKRYKKQDCGR